MRVTIANVFAPLIVVILMTGGITNAIAQTSPAQSKPVTPGLLALLEKSGYSYSKVTEGVYEIPATGKNLKEFPLRLTLADDLLIVIAKFADRKDVAINQAMAVKLLELNDHFDSVKFALSNDLLYARMDIHVRLVDGEELKYLVEQMARVIDEAYVHIKPFIR